MPSTGTGCRVLDTRKTTPGLRALEKAAAAAGGVTNHRMGLYDAILIKNNHIAAAGGVRNALERARHSGLPIEIEVRTRAELHEALDCGANHLLLDNLTPARSRRLDPRDRRPRQGRTLRRHHAGKRARLRRNRRRFRLLRRHHPLRPRHGHQLPPGVGVMRSSTRLRAGFPRARTILYFDSIDSTMRVAAAQRTRHRRPRRGADRRPGPPRPRLALRTGAGIYCSHRARRPTPVLTLALGLATAEAIAQPPACMRPPLAQRPHARRPQGRRHPGPTGQRQRHRRHRHQRQPHRVSRPNSTAEATSLRLHAGRELAREDILIALLPAIDAVIG